MDSRHTDLTLQARAIIAELSREAVPSVDTTADRLSVSTRSLQRYLALHGTTYTELVDLVRFELAQDLLGQPRLKVSIIAARLGYGDPSSFSRAFLRWSGMTPCAWRASLGKPL